MTVLDQALRQLEQLQTFCALCERLPLPPVTLPPNPVRAAGLDPDIWHGLGIVGLWAAIDAFAERRQPQDNGSSLINRLSAFLPPELDNSLKELDDMRHLYAHNFAGIADATYFKKRTRNFFKSGSSYKLSSGNQFDGHRLILTLHDFEFYIDRVREILRYLDRTWPGGRLHLL